MSREIEFAWENAWRRRDRNRLFADRAWMMAPGGSRSIDVRFSTPTESAGASDIEFRPYWTNHPQRVVETYEEVEKAPSRIDQTWRHIVFDVTNLNDSTPMVWHEVSRQLPKVKRG